jgi:hypothetical protein
MVPVVTLLKSDSEKNDRSIKQFIISSRFGDEMDTSSTFCFFLGVVKKGRKLGGVHLTTFT